MGQLYHEGIAIWFDCVFSNLENVGVENLEAPPP